jgi:hypothetical protein
MAWIDNLNSDFIIQTGDGKQYKVLWQNATQIVEYNVATFDFSELEGTLVKRKKPKGTRYGLEFYFTGENCIDDFLAFKESAKDPRAWVISHPFYGNIVVQPIRLNIDNTKYNSTYISGEVIETIEDTPTKFNVSAVEKIMNDKEVLDKLAIKAVTLPPLLRNLLKLIKTIKAIAAKIKGIIKLAQQAQALINKVNQAVAAVINAIGKPLAALRALQALVNYPAMIIASVKQRLTSLTDAFTELRTSISNTFGKSGKQYYQFNATNILSSMCLTVATPINTLESIAANNAAINVDEANIADPNTLDVVLKPTDAIPGVTAGAGVEPDYPNRAEVAKTIETLLANYNAYLDDLDLLQSDNGTDVDAFIPDADSLIALSDLVNFTISVLFDIALNSKQERTVVLEEDTNVILATHRFLGLDENDSNIAQFISNNNISLNEIFQLKKGRTITYYV